MQENPATLMKKISVQVKAGAKVNLVEDLSERSFRVKVKAPPVEGKANDAVIAVLAEHFHVPKSHIRLCSGRTSKKKIFEIG